MTLQFFLRVEAMFQQLDKIVRVLSQTTYVIGTIMIGLMMIHVVVHVFFQYVLNDPLPGTILFVSNYYMVVVTFLCLGAVELKGGHISVDLLYSHFSSHAQRICSIVASLITVVIFALLTWQSFVVAEARRTAGTFEIEYGVKILIWPSYYIVTIGSAIFVFFATVRLVHLIAGVPEPIENPDNSTN